MRFGTFRRSSLMLFSLVFVSSCSYPSATVSLDPIVTPTFIEFPSTALDVDVPLGLPSLVGSDISEADVGQCVDSDAECFVVGFLDDEGREQIFVAVAGNARGVGPLGNVLGEVRDLSESEVTIDVAYLTGPGYDIRLAPIVEPNFLDCSQSESDFSQSDDFVYLAHHAESLRADISCYPKGDG